MNTLEEIFSNCTLDNKTGCWNWSRAIEPHSGYGAVKFQGKKMNTHRVVWILLYGELDRDILVCHHCDNKKCINPEHLFAGTYSDNMQDCKQKGRLVVPVGVKLMRGEKNIGAKLTENDVVEIKKCLINGDKQIDIAKDYNVTRYAISKIATGNTWKHIKV